MRKTILLLVLVLVLDLVLSTNSHAIYAPRALGMGEAFTAIADDAYASYYNPAGFAINPGIDLIGSYQLNNRNLAIGDNAFALKGCFEIGMNPYDWVLGLGLASTFAYEGAKYLHDEGIVKKGWGREGETYSKDESMAEEVETGGQADTKISRKEVLKKAAREIAKTTINVAGKMAEAVVKEAAFQVRPYYYAPNWYRPNYYRPSLWDNRYAYSSRELTPANKAQFGGAITVMVDRNALLSQDTRWYSFSVASGYAETVALGANVNIYDLENTTLNVRGMGGGLDVGGLLRLNNKLFLGVAAKELLTTDIKWENGTVNRYQMNVNAGIGLKPIDQLLVAADVHNLFYQNGRDATLHYGLEFKPVYGLALRAGLSDNSKTAGFSFGVGQLIIDYAILGGTYNRTQMISATWKM